MRQILATRAGGPEQLKLVGTWTAKPGPNELSFKWRPPPQYAAAGHARP